MDAVFQVLVEGFHAAILPRVVHCCMISRSCGILRDLGSVVGETADGFPYLEKMEVQPRDEGSRGRIGGVQNFWES